MTETSPKQTRRPGWVFLIPVAWIVAFLTWFIVATSGR